MKLYEVELTIRAVVLADDEAEAMQEAHTARREIIADYDMQDWDVAEIFKGQRLPTGWVEQCYPFGRNNSEQTIEQIWSEEK